MSIRNRFSNESSRSVYFRANIDSQRDPLVLQCDASWRISYFSVPCLCCSNFIRICNNYYQRKKREKAQIWFQHPSSIRVMTRPDEGGLGIHIDYRHTFTMRPQSRYSCVRFSPELAKMATAMVNRTRYLWRTSATLQPPRHQLIPQHITRCKIPGKSSE